MDRSAYRELKNMKTIIIESVSNGWIVTDRFADIGIAQQPIAVYNDIADLQAALPALLGVVVQELDPFSPRITSIKPPPAIPRPCTY